MPAHAVKNALAEAGDVIEFELPRGSDTGVALLRRVDVVAPDATLALETLGGAVEPLTVAASLWSGQVVGQPGSDAFLGISPTQA